MLILKIIKMTILWLMIFTTWSSYASAVLGIVILSICLSVHHTCALWRNERTYCLYFDTHERVITLVFWYQQWLVSDVPFHLQFALKVTPPFEKRQLRPISAYNVSTIRTSEKCSIIANKKSTTHIPTSYRWNAYLTPTKGWLKKRICSFYV